MSTIETNDQKFKTLKILLVGPNGSGKTSILKKFMGEESDSKHRSTFGLDFRVKDIMINNFICKLQIVDTSSKPDLQVDYDFYILYSDVIMFVYDISKNKSIFDNFYREFLEKITMIEEAKKNKNINDFREFKEKFKVLVGNKSDINRVIEFNEGEKIKKDKKMDLFFEVSAENGKYISGLFESTTSQYYDKEQLEAEERNKKGGNENTNNNAKKSNCLIF